MNHIFLAERSNGVYYLWFFDEFGKERKFGMKTHSKPEAQRFLQDFIQQGKEQKIKLTTTPLSQFLAEMPAYRANDQSSKTQKTFSHNLP